MLDTGEKLGAFIVPTGLGASIGGYAGDASVWARRFARAAKLIVNPNVVNAGGFSGITQNMLYVEGYSLDSFFKGEINLLPSDNNKIGIVFDKAIPEDVLNIHINTMNAVKTVYDIDLYGYDVTEQELGVEFFIDENGISTGGIKNPQTLLHSCRKLLQQGAEALALVGMFEDPEDDNPDYANGTGVDPVGGVEAIISHFISKELQVPCAHSPAFDDYTISPKLVDPRSASEYITPTFLPCILLGLTQAPKLTTEKKGISIDNLDFLVMPYDAVGSIPVFESLKRNINICLIKENTTTLNITPDVLGITDRVKVFETYQECLNFIEM